MTLGVSFRRRHKNVKDKEKEECIDQLDADHLEKAIHQVIENSG